MRFTGHFPFWSRIHRRQQHELRGKRHRARRAGNGDAAFLQRLAQRLQNAALELRQFVQEQNAVVRERDFTRGRIDVAAEQAGVARRVMRRAKRPARDQRLARREQADDAVDLRRFQRLVQSQRRQNRGKPFRQHGFARAGRADEQRVVPSGGGDFQRTFDVFLSLHLGKIQFVVGRLVKNLCDVHLHRRDFDFAFQELRRLPQVLDRDNL